MIVISFSSLWKLFIKVRKKGAGGWKGIRNKINYIENNSINVSTKTLTPSIGGKWN